MVEFPKFKGFASETKLHGIPRMAEGSKPSIAFWSVLFAICVGMAANDLYELLTRYQLAPTAIQMALVNLPADFNWTTPTLCMEMIVDYDNTTSGSQVQWGYPDSLYQQGRDIVANIRSLFKTMFGQNYTEMAYYDGVNSPNFIYYSYMMLGYLIDLEQRLMGQAQWANKQLSSAEQIDPLIGEHSQYFYLQYSQYNVSMDQLTQIVGMWYCLKQLKLDIVPLGDGQNKMPYPQIYGHMENYRYFGDPDYINLPMCKANMITHLGFGMVCSKVFETPTVPIRPDYRYFTIYDTLAKDQLMSLAALMDPSFSHAKLVPNLQLHLDLQGRNVIPTDDRTNVFSWSPADTVVLDITVSTEYQFLNTKKRSCSTSPVSQADCIWQKRVDFVHQQCGCWPSLADIQNQKSGRNCSVDPTNPLLNTIYNISAEQLCPNIVALAPDLSECIMDCHLSNYSFTQLKPNRFPSYARSWSRAMEKTSGSFEFRFGSVPHTLISDYVTTDWNNFLGTWGGSIGTWLGASLLAFVHIPVYIFRQYCLCKAKPAVQ